VGGEGRWEGCTFLTKDKDKDKEERGGGERWEAGRRWRWEAGRGGEEGVTPL
jgi:hypothetical protein